MFDVELLKTFLLVAEGRSFSETSRKLGIRQSTVSDQVRRLEKMVGRRLFVRDTHSVQVTPDGEALIEFAQSIVDINERAKMHFATASTRHKIRLGASEDLAMRWLPPILKRFGAAHQDVDIELAVALSSTLISRFNHGELDVVVCKRWRNDERGRLLASDDLVWAGSGDLAVRPEHPVPLILYPQPSFTRAIAINCLQEARTPWRIACMSETLTGLTGAAEAGLGVIAFARRLLPKGLRVTTLQHRLPKLGAIDFAVMQKPGLKPVAKELVEQIHSEGRNWWPAR